MKDFFQNIICNKYKWHFEAALSQSEISDITSNIGTFELISYNNKGFHI